MGIAEKRDHHLTGKPETVKDIEIHGDSRMSMIAKYKRISRQQLKQLLAQPDKILDFVQDEDEDDGAFGLGDSDNEGLMESEGDKVLDIDKAWQAIHFLLTRDPWLGAPPLSDAVLGGNELGGPDLGYGSARYLTDTEVEEVASALAAISKDLLLSRFKLDEFVKHKIYPNAWTGSTGDRRYIAAYYERLVAFFQNASASGNAMLLYLN